MSGPELKPCPFCGVSARLRNDTAHSTAFWIGCDSDSCFGNLLWEETKAEAIAAWNTRAPVDYAALPEVQALIAEAEEAADAIDMAYGDPHDEGTPHRYSAKLRAAIAAIRKRGEG